MKHDDSKKREVVRRFPYVNPRKDEVSTYFDSFSNNRIVETIVRILRKLWLIHISDIYN